MKIPLSWLQDWISVPLTAAETARRLTMAGLEVESVDIVGGRFRGVTVGRILGVEPIPKADKLRLCRVDVGFTVLPVVCGAPNVREGVLVPVAVEGAELPGGVTIRRAVIRNTESRGMICSVRELGMGEDHSGVLILEETLSGGASFRPGDPFTDREQADFVLDINITTNRPDCLSVRGIAREMALLAGCEFRPPVSGKTAAGTVSPSPGVDIRIEDAEGCPRYSARRLSEVTIGPSPDWMRKRLALCGVNAINNVVDVTNYVMLETGQPLHAFDADRLEGGRIVVRRAADLAGK